MDKPKFRITIEDLETNEKRTTEVNGYLLGKTIKEKDGDLDYTLVYEGVDKGNLAFLSKMLDAELTSMLLEAMGIL
jgi:hypothetical protein